MLVRLGHGGEIGVAVGDVELDRQHRVAVLHNEIIEGRRVARGCCNGVTSLERS
jgi:hypothetical protein